MVSGHRRAPQLQENALHQTHSRFFDSIATGLDSFHQGLHLGILGFQSSLHLLEAKQGKNRLRERLPPFHPSKISEIWTQISTSPAALYVASACQWLSWRLAKIPVTFRCPRRCAMASHSSTAQCSINKNDRLLHLLLMFLNCGALAASSKLRGTVDCQCCWHSVSSLYGWSVIVVVA